MRNTWQIATDSKLHQIYYPPEIARRVPEWLDEAAHLLVEALPVPSHIRGLLNEVYTALQAGSYRLAAMGVRAALEAVMIEKVGDLRSFKRHVDAFAAAGYLSVRQAGSLETILEAGHATIHRGWEPTAADLSTLLDIAETIVATVYIHEDSANVLEQRVPKRQRPSGQIEEK